MYSKKAMCSHYRREETHMEGFFAIVDSASAWPLKRMSE